MELILACVVIGAFTAAIASAKGRSVVIWFILGCAFNLIALLAVAIFPSLKEPAPSPRTHARCRECKEYVLKNARVCKHCGYKLIKESTPPA